MYHNFFLNETLFVKLDIKYEIIFFFYHLSWKRRQLFKKLYKGKILNISVIVVHPACYQITFTIIY